MKNNVTFHVHPLFWVMMLFALLAGQFVQVITIFLLVLCHEVGHVIAAAACGWRVRSIVLLPFGGVAEIDEWGTTQPLHEFIVDLAGPAVNGLLFVLGYVGKLYNIWSSEWAAFFMYSNIIIAGFNLLPIWPLDGGRVLQTLCTFVFSYRNAVRLSFCIGIAGSIGLIFWSASQPVPQFNGIAVACYLLFLNIMAYRKLPFHYLRFLLMRHEGIERIKKLPVRSVKVAGHQTVFEITRKIKRSHYHFFYIENRPYQMFSEDLLLHHYFTHPPNYAVEHLLR
ncbi:M50 family metallopeptidase [Aneurinibacillus sp. Ricciae_BoGa-3]|uniref:M50 family metallopeptidase n=1 Tax=Aneurinibacillus sp. Ricciae_BoGa-3 TaxID=3022697 RepID=UPI00233F91D6|nr:M50 family metallopeptidase [Aneurinibacillus sp. Ricciae_BoGa-3]WCK53637.1 M50 family metallopeptidase [Aneurinibacillus sp. Ricciae_BoGa-3]